MVFSPSTTAMEGRKESRLEASDTHIHAVVLTICSGGEKTSSFASKRELTYLFQTCSEETRTETGWRLKKSRPLSLSEFL